jgi:hypothetical protein
MPTSRRASRPRFFQSIAMRKLHAPLHPRFVNDFGRIPRRIPDL